MLILPLIIDINRDLQGAFLFGTEENSLGNYLSIVIDILLTVGLIMTLIFLLIGAMNWITAEGKPEKLEKARNTIVHSIVGLAFMMGAWAIWLLITKSIFGINLTSSSAGSGTNTNNQSSPATVLTDCTADRVGQRVNFGGSGGYCTDGGASQVQCHAPDNHLSYYHFDPCLCLSGSPLPGFDFSSCY